MVIRRCEYCRNRLPEGMRVNAAFCGDNCRVNAHKKRKRDYIRQWKLSKVQRPIVSFPNHKLWTEMIEKMRQHYPREAHPLGYRLMRRGSIFPNLQDSIRVVDGDLRTDSYYHWAPFEPPSVPEVGDYKFQWWFTPNIVTPDFESGQALTCFVALSDPQASFHNNRPVRRELSAVAWQRQVKLKLRIFKK